MSRIDRTSNEHFRETALVGHFGNLLSGIKISCFRYLWWSGIIYSERKMLKMQKEERTNKKFMDVVRKDMQRVIENTMMWKKIFWCGDNLTVAAKRGQKVSNIFISNLKLMN